MNDLFKEPLPVPLEAQITAVEREIAMRIAVYGRRVDDGKMKAERAHAEIGAMRAVLRTLVGIRDNPRTPFAWFDHFNNEIVRGAEEVKAREKGGNKVTPLFTA